MTIFIAYISVLCTISILIKFLEMSSMANTIERNRKEAEAYRQKQDEINEEVLYLHRELLAAELEILQELKRR